MKRLLIAGCLLICSISYSQQTYYDVTAGNGYGIRFWQIDEYKIHMGNSAEYLYGPVTDYSVKMNMRNLPGRGWTWGTMGATPIAALNNAGDLQIAGSFFTAKIGIGTSSPAGGLDVRSGSSYAIRTLTSNRYIIEVRNTSDAGGGWWLVNDPNGNFALHENGFADGDRFTIKAGGNIGIGTSTPWGKLDVIGPVTGSGPTISARGGGDVLLGAGGSLFFDGNYSYASGNYIRPLTSNSQSFFTSGVERLRITSDGKLGIGTSSPDGRLEIKGAGGQLKLTGGTVAAGLWTGHTDLLHLADWNTGNYGLTINMTTGNVGIGTKSPNEKLTVNGTVYSKEVKVDLSVPAPDYVFSDTYRLRSIRELEAYIRTNSHLPEVPSALELEKNGIKVGEMNMVLLKKIEELTLYIIDLKKENAALRDDVFKRIQDLESAIGNK